MIIRRFQRFHAADTGLEVPAVTHAPSSTIVDVPLTAPDLGKLDVHAALGVPNNIRGPQDIFGEEESPESINARIEGDAGRARRPDGTFLPKGEKEPAQAKQQPEKQPRSKAAPAAKPVETPPAEPKIKIGDQEKTAAEWADYHKELAEKAEKAAAPAEKPAETPKQDEPKDDPTAAREAFIAEASKQYMPTQEEFDKMLANGDAEAFGRYFAKLEANVREWTIATVAPHIDRLNGELQPMTSKQQEIEQYQTEARFLDSNPEIKAAVAADPAKIAVPRELSQQLFEELQDMKFLMERNPENTRAKARAAAIEGDFLGELSKLTKEKLGIAAAPSATAAPAAASPLPKPKTAAPTEKPLSTDRPGAATSPRTESAEARLARELLEA